MKEMVKIYSFLIFLCLLIGCGKNEEAETGSREVVKPVIKEVEKSPFISIAHRGASAYLPEHTIPAYELAAEWGADYIELDLHMTADGHLVAIHDQTVDRTTDGTGYVHHLSLEELKQLNAATNFQGDEQYDVIPIPTLEEVLEHFGDSVNYYIELKNPENYPDMVETLFQQLQEFDLLHKKDDKGLDKVILQSFHEESLRELYQLEPSLPLIQLFNRNDSLMLSKKDFQKVKTYAIGVGIPYQTTTASRLAMIHNEGLLVHVYTINDEKLMEQYINLGVDGIFTDRVDVLIDLLEKKGH